MIFFIEHTADVGMFWNNEHGWVDLGGATKFTHEESLTMKPALDGCWIDEEEAVTDALSVANIWIDDYYLGEFAEGGRK